MFEADPKSKQMKPKIQYLVRNGFSLKLCAYFIKIKDRADKNVPIRPKMIAYIVCEFELIFFY